MADLTGQTLGNYRIEALLGSGGMGQVYRATHIHLNRPAAVKVLHEQYAADPTFQARFQQEAQAASALRNPNIIEVIDFGQADGRFYLVMELLSEGSVRTLLQQRAGAGTPLALPLGVDLVRQAADGLAYAHAQGMVHRDMKPDNLLISRGGNVPVGPSGYNVKLTDFGLARLAEGGVATAHGATMGTPAYMSPEQCQALELDGRSDIYSLGVVLYEVTTGYLPFETKSLSDAVYKHVYTEPPPPRQVKPDLPDKLEAIILRCLKKAPAERYQTAKELADALRELYQTLGPVSPLDAAPATQMGRLEGIQVLLDRETYAVSPGVPAQIRVTLANLGQLPAPVDLTVDGIPAEWLTLPAMPIQVAAGAPQNVVVQVLVPRDAGITSGARPLTITGRSRANPPQTAAATASLSIQPFSLDEATLAPTRVSGRGGGTATLTLKNGGNAPVTWNIQATSGDPALSVELPGTSTTVEAGATKAVPVKLHASRRWSGGAKTMPFTVQAAPAGGQVFNLPGELNQPIVAPLWGVALGAVAALALVGGGVAYAMRGGGATPDPTPTVTAVIVTATSAPIATATEEPPATPTDVATATEEVSTPTVASVDTPTVPVVVFTPTAEPSAAGRILFAANVGTGLHTMEVMTIGSDGSDPQQLTDNQWDDWGAQWSPDGLGITYIEQIFPVGAETNANIYIMNADGSDKRPVTRFPGMNEWPIWSPDGLKILYSTRRDGNNEIHVFDLTTNTDTNVSNFEGGDYTPYWAPDSTRVIFSSGRSGGNDLYVANADGSGDPIRLTSEPTSESLPVWSADDTKIVFVRTSGDTSDLVIMNTDGTGQQVIATNVAPQPDTEFSPDGTRIIYVGMASGNPDIYAVAVDGSEQSRVQLTVDPADDNAPAWSPDGTMIAFLTTRDNILAADTRLTKQLYVMAADGSSQTRISTEPVEHWYPDWRP
jgi:Tol biopolymer transport system component